MIDKQIFDTLLEPIFVLNSDGQIIYCNEVAATLSDSSVRKLQRQKSKLIEIFNFSEELSEISNPKSITEPSPYKEITFQNPNGAQGKSQITIQPLVQNSEWIVFMRDVTLEEKLQKKYRAELEQKEGFIVQLENANKQLEDYSKNLEVKVAERTAELSQITSLMKALLDSLHDGFFVFDSQGKCLEVSSKACESILEINPNVLSSWIYF